MAKTDNTTPESVGDLRSFQRDALFVIASIGPASGLDVKAKLEEYYGTEENHGRLYPNLDAIVELGLVDKTEADGRTNWYSLTDAGWQALDARRSWEGECVGRNDGTADLTGDVHDLLLNYQRDGEDLGETLHRVLSLVPHPTRLPSSASRETVERDELVIVRARDTDDYLDTFTYESAYDVHTDIQSVMEAPADD